MITIVVAILALSLLYMFYPTLKDKVVPVLGVSKNSEKRDNKEKETFSGYDKNSNMKSVSKRDEYIKVKDIPEKRKAWLVEKRKLDGFSANNVLSFTGNKKCDGKKIQNEADEPDHNNVITWDFNHDCGMNPQYLKSMCLQKRYTNKERLCSSLVDIVQRPQDPNNPKNFIGF